MSFIAIFRQPSNFLPGCTKPRDGSVMFQQDSTDFQVKGLGLSPGLDKLLMKSFISSNTSDSFDWKTS
jgi:hypothetical protein